jgi:uncharacterized phiE125 gp8 family phage protein
MKIISRAGSQLITADQAKANSRDTLSAEDLLWGRWVDLAHEVVERETGMVLQQAVVDDYFTDGVIVLRSPVRSIVSVKTYDDEGTEATTTDFKTTPRPGYGLRLELTTVPANYAVVRYVAGFGSYTVPGGETAVNESITEEVATLEQVLLAITDHFYNHRGIVTDFQKYATRNSFKFLTNGIANHR